MYEYLGPTRGPHRVLRIPEPGFIASRQFIDNIAVLFTDMHAKQGHGLLGLEREHENI